MKEHGFRFQAIASVALAMTVYVSPTGVDTNPGTRDAPLRTLEAARDEVRGRLIFEAVHGFLGVGDGHDRLFHAMEGLAAHKFAQMLRANGDGDHLAEPHCLRRVFGQTDVRRKREFSHMPLAERAQVGGALPAPHADLVPNLMQIPRDK